MFSSGSLLLYQSVTGSPLFERRNHSFKSSETRSVPNHRLLEVLDLLSEKAHCSIADRAAITVISCYFIHCHFNTFRLRIQYGTNSCSDLTSKRSSALARKILGSGRAIIKQERKEEALCPGQEHTDYKCKQFWCQLQSGKPGLLWDGGCHIRQLCHAEKYRN